MKRASLITFVVLLGFLLAVPAAQAAPASSPFHGHWEGIDPIDGSNLDALISVGNHP